MKVEEIAEAIAKLPPDQFARFRKWFTAYDAGRADHKHELEFDGDEDRPVCRPDVCRASQTLAGLSGRRSPPAKRPR